jgi:hypothetical protein
MEEPHRDVKPHRFRNAVGRALQWLKGPVYDPYAACAEAAWVCCGFCDSTAVCPMSWAPDGEHAWTVQVRCGECGWWAELGLSNAQAAHFDVVLNEQESLIAEAVRRLERERVAHDFEMLIHGLAHDLIGPDDFASPRFRQQTR